MQRVNELRTWLVNAAPCSVTVYYTGDLGGDPTPFADEVRVLAWDAMRNGLVHLIQRRTKTIGMFEYVAIKRAAR
jgi:hypothetical protein